MAEFNDILNIDVLDSEDEMETPQTEMVCDSAVKMYLREMGQTKMLTADEEKKLTEAAAKGDKDAKDKLVKANLRLVISQAKKNMGHGMTFLDLIQEGNIGLMTAADKFNPSLGFKFSTYAMYWIKQAITRAVANQSRMIRVPVHMIENMSKYQKAQKDLVQKNGIEPSIEEIAKEMNISVEDALEIQSHFVDASSLDTPVGEDGDATVGSLVEDTNNVNPQDSYEQEDMVNTLNAVLDTLSVREKTVIMMRFGVGYSRSFTLEEVGKEVGVTRERVRQIEAAAMKKLRNPIRANKLKEYVA